MPEYSNRTGGYVDPPAAKGARESLQVIVQGNAAPVLVTGSTGGTDYVENGTGFGNEDVILNAKRAFAQQLLELSLDLVEQIKEDKTEIGNPNGPEYDKRIFDKLSLKEATSQLYLEQLKTIGFGLRDKLNPKLFDAFKKRGFMKQQPAEEPAMAFYTYGQAQVLWDMMYEELDPGEDAEWEHFWGFRVPITHWQPGQNRDHKIQLKRGLFSAVDETLAFANDEVSLLAQQLTGGLCHRSLCDEFKNRAQNELRRKLNDPAAVEKWFQAQTAKSWFSSFIEKLNEGTKEQDAITLQTIKWKEKAIRAIFSDPEFTYELIHFACHCEPDKLSELLSQLKIHIAGEEISLSVALMSVGGEARSDQPGSLVFLNACGTGEQGQNAEPPGFPENWISKRGALGVVATLCTVPDLFAHAFARKFYKTLFESVANAKAPMRERYLAEALLETRRFFMTECRNPLGLAYVLYSVRDACIEPHV